MVVEKECVKTNPDELLELVWACVVRDVDLRKERAEEKPRRARLGFMNQYFKQPVITGRTYLCPALSNALSARLDLSGGCNAEKRPQRSLNL